MGNHDGAESKEEERNEKGVREEMNHGDAPASVNDS